jgi:thiol-disulfide isomerase/thioredoxin
MTSTELPPDDRPPVRPPRRVSPGLLAAAVLATVVLAIATLMAFVAGDGSDEQVNRLDPNATLAPSPFGPAELEGAAKEVEGTTLPSLTYTTFDGEERPLSTGGKPLVVNFWAANCVPCVAEMPAIEEVYRANGDRLGWLGVQAMESADRGLKMAQQTGVTYPLGRDPQGTLVQALGGIVLPTTVLIAADGTITEVHVGELTAGELQGLIDQHLPG